MGRAGHSKFTDEQAKTFGAEVRRLRKEAGLSRSDFAELVEVTPIHITHIEAAQRKASPQLAEKLASVFGVTVNDILGLSDSSEPSDANDERVWEFRRKYGATLKAHREAKGLPCRVVAGALGVPLQVYKEWEQGLCSIGESQMEMLDRLLGIGEKPKVETVEVVVEVPAEVPTEICDIIMGHIKDLQVSEDEQKEVWRYFKGLQLDAEERKIFG